MGLDAGVTACYIPLDEKKCKRFNNTLIKKSKAQRSLFSSAKLIQNLRFDNTSVEILTAINVNLADSSSKAIQNCRRHTCFED
mmetsp:Transcript_16826/g.20758  ORF Transcript_16826/g.20758 Transcript_16826/m.20758 type:complete len:83 (+) Transcript_16826:1424-1672(+)